MCGWNQENLQRKEVGLHTYTQLSASTSPTVSLKGMGWSGFSLSVELCALGSEALLGSKVQMRYQGGPSCNTSSTQMKRRK